MNAQRLKFTQQKKSEDMIDIGVSKRNAANRRIPHSLSRMQFRRGFDLRAQVRRRAQQKPRKAVLANRNLRLAARFSAKCPRPHSAAICAGAIPLRKRTSGRRSKNLYLHLCEFTAWD